MSEHVAARTAETGLAGLLAALHGPAAVDVSPSVEALCASAYADGHRDGQTAAEAALASLRARLAAAAATLEAATVIDAGELRPVFTELVRRVCGAALDAELRLTPDALQPLVDAALAAAGARATRLRLHPDTLAALELPGLAIVLEADPALAADDVALDGPAFALEASLAARLATIVAALP